MQVGRAAQFGLRNAVFADGFHVPEEFCHRQLIAREGLACGSHKCEPAIGSVSIHTKRKRQVPNTFEQTKFADIMYAQ